MSTVHTAEDMAAPSANVVTVNHSKGSRSRHSSTHMKLLQHITVITREMRQSHRWAATPGNTPITGSGTSYLSSGTLTTGSGTSQHIQKGIQRGRSRRRWDSNTNPPTIKTAITLQLARTEAALSRKLHAMIIEQGICLSWSE